MRKLTPPSSRAGNQYLVYSLPRRDLRAANLETARKGSANLPRLRQDETWAGAGV